MEADSTSQRIGRHVESPLAEILVSSPFYQTPVYHGQKEQLLCLWPGCAFSSHSLPDFNIHYTCHRLYFEISRIQDHDLLGEAAKYLSFSHI
jgi:hypothetical protein